MMNHINGFDILSDNIKRSCFDLGVAIALNNQVLEKRGLNSLSELPEKISKAVIGLSLIAGIPTGVAAHLLGRKLHERSLKQKELEAQLDYYRNAASELEQALAKGD